TRTQNQRLKRALLYRLSYQPIRLKAWNIILETAAATLNYEEFMPNQSTQECLPQVRRIRRAR
ncbi:MAG: hypothetical protein WB586_10950, partial [Chthoniobacterales bacterium]